MNNKQVYRNWAKRLYKKNKQEDRKIGFKINNLVSLIVKALNEKKQGYENLLDSYKTEFVDLRKEKRFREDFPTFALFYQYLKENNISQKQIEEMYSDSEAV
jgi:hypothetical protein